MADPTYNLNGGFKPTLPTKGYGFIQPQGGGKDVFVHISAVERAGLSSLNEGQAIEFELVSNKGKTSAENLKVRR
jgi:cold shock protein